MCINFNRIETVRSTGYERQNQRHLNVTHGVGFKKKQKPTRPVESLPVSPRRRRRLCRNPTLASTNKDESAVVRLVLHIKSVVRVKKNFIKRVNIKNTADEQLSQADN